MMKVRALHRIALLMAQSACGARSPYAFANTICINIKLSRGRYMQKAGDLTKRLRLFVSNDQVRPLRNKNLLKILKERRKLLRICPAILAFGLVYPGVAEASDGCALVGMFNSRAKAACEALARRKSEVASFI